MKVRVLLVDVLPELRGRIRLLVLEEIYFAGLFQDVSFVLYFWLLFFLFAVVLLSWFFVLFAWWFFVVILRFFVFLLQKVFFLRSELITDSIFSFYLFLVNTLEILLHSMYPINFFDNCKSFAIQTQLNLFILINLCKIHNHLEILVIIKLTCLDFLKDLRNFFHIHFTESQLTSLNIRLGIKFKVHLFVLWWIFQQLCEDL